LLTVAEYFIYAYGGDREPLERALRDEIQKPCGPRPIHTVLAQLEQVKIIITSNYDDLLEQEIPKYGRKLARHVYNPRNPRTGHFDFTTFLETDDIVLHKMNGTAEEPGSMVITQSDYIYYLANLTDIDRGMPEYFRKIMIPQCTLLFLGYSLEDWNFRVIWEGVLSGCAHRHIRKDAYALVKNPDHFQKKYWARRNIDILDKDLTEFALHLAEYFKLDIPQLDIKKGRPGGVS
jgi:prophage maintenance system killer protein